VARWTYEEALVWLESHANLEAAVAMPAPPTLDRMRRLVALMGDPQAAAPVVHLTGTNGKGSTARMITALLGERGLGVGTYTSPDLERVNERLARSLRPIPDDELTDLLAAIGGLEELMGERLTRFEVLTGAALRWFADVAVDAAVLEVGMGGWWDATNVVDGQVAVVTNVSLDHAEVLGPTLVEIAREKAGIVKPASTLVLGATEEALAAEFLARPAGAVWQRNRDFAVTDNRPAHGGRLVSVRTPGGVYEDVYLPFHGAHQGDNAAVAVAAVEAFFDAPLDDEVVRQAFGALTLPGRMEVVGRQPLVVLDGAHNPAGAHAAAATMAGAFGTEGALILVVGMLQGREPVEMLDALGGRRARLVVACPAPSPRSLPPADVAVAAGSLGVTARAAVSVRDAVALALDVAGEDDVVLVTGSLYVVGAARAALRDLRPGAVEDVPPRR
ncbi:MAG: bifunctional folylpolyglutamate synthase/dihydrofolate synthase, partial [Acidimicrobiales bacterium]